MLLLTKRNLKNIREFIKVNYRTMFTTRQLTKNVNMNLIRANSHLGHNTSTNVANPTSLKNVQRNMPGQGYDCGRYNKDTRTATGKNLPQHEAVHVNIIDRQSQKNVGLFSSCKKPGFSFIAKDNMKQDVLQNGQPKQQWATSFQTCSSGASRVRSLRL